MGYKKKTPLLIQFYATNRRGRGDRVRDARGLARQYLENKLRDTGRTTLQPS